MHASSACYSKFSKIEVGEPQPISMHVAYEPVRFEISEVNLSIPGNQQLSPKPWKIAVGTGAPVDKISLA